MSYKDYKHASRRGYRIAIVGSNEPIIRWPRRTPSDIASTRWKKFWYPRLLRAENHLTRAAFAWRNNPRKVNWMMLVLMLWLALMGK